MWSKMYDEITYQYPEFNSYIIEVWEWTSNYIPHFVMDVISYLCLD